MKASTLPVLEIPINRVWTLDPGNLKTGWTLFDVRTRLVDDHGHTDNETVMRMFAGLEPDGDAVVIESMANQNKKCGGQVFQACWWGGRFEQEARNRGHHVETITRNEARCYVADQYSGDAGVKRALVKIYGAELRSWSSHELAALAVAHKFVETRLPVNPFHP